MFDAEAASRLKPRTLLPACRVPRLKVAIAAAAHRFTDRPMKARRVAAALFAVTVVLGGCSKMSPFGQDPGRPANPLSDEQTKACLLYTSPSPRD